MKNITMFNRRAVAIVATAFLCITASAQTHYLQLKQNNKTEINGKKAFKALPVKSSASNSAYRLAPRKDWYDGSTTEDILIDEDFSLLTTGTVDDPDTLTQLCTAYGSNSDWYINSKYTHQPGWCGSWAYPAGGACALIDPYGYIGALINTPLGDYSGDLTITFKAKGLSKSTMLMVNVLKDGYNNPAAACEHATNQYNFYKGQGWTKVTLKVTNKCAANDGFIQFLAYGELVIDDIQVTATPNFLAAPVINPITNFKKHEFTANWQKVRKASNYYLNLYKLSYNSTNDSTITQDFESINDDASNLTGWNYVNNSSEKISPDQGVDGSKAIILHNNDTLSTPDNMAKYRNMKFWLKVCPNGASDDDLYSTIINVQVKTLSGWKDLGDFYGYYFKKGSDLDMMEQTDNGFKNKYYAVRITTSSLPDKSYMVLDNFNIEEGPSANLEAIYVDTLSYPGLFYDYTKNLSYTFQGLDSLTDYYYSVRSHYMMMYSDEVLQPAFGVSAPEVKPATDIDERGGYTANWEPSPKATRYTITNFGVRQAAADEEKHVVLDEDFSKINADVTSATDPYNPEAVGNTKPVSLDDYTNIAGWTSNVTTLAQGMVGCGQSEDYLPYVKTPKLYLMNDSLYYLTIKAYGTIGDYMRIRTTTYDYDYVVPFKDSGDGKTGIIDDTFTIPERGNYTIRFSSYGKVGFMLDNVKVTQNLKAGDKVYTTLSSATFGADTLSYRFTGLDKYDYDFYAYNVVAYLDGDDGSVATSDPSDYQMVVLNPAGVSNINDTKVVREVARYNVNGMRLSSPVKGLNIVKLSNGKTIKVIVR